MHNVRSNNYSLGSFKSEPSLQSDKI